MDQKEAHDRLFQRLLEIGEPSPEDWDFFRKGFRLLELPAEHSLLRAGDQTSQLWFLAEGLMRMYYVGKGGREVNKAFVPGGGFVGALDSLLCDEPSRVHIETLNASTVLVAPYAHFVAMYARGAYWERLGRVSVEQLYVRKLRREAALLMDPPRERYEAFLREMPALDEQIPNYQIASYLGITPETLSRIRKARSRGPV